MQDQICKYERVIITIFPIWQILITINYQDFDKSKKYCLKHYYQLAKILVTDWQLPFFANLQTGKW